MMKKLFAAVLAAFILLAFSGCNQPNTVDNNSEEPTLNDVVSKKASNSILKFFDENKDYTFKTADYSNHSFADGDIIYYCKDNEIKRMTLSIFDLMGQKFYDFYMLDGSVCYAIVTDTRYKDKLFVDPTIENEVMREYYIIGDEVMVYSTDKGDLIKYKNTNDDNDDDVLTVYKDAKSKFTE